MSFGVAATPSSASRVGGVGAGPAGLVAALVPVALQGLAVMGHTAGGELPFTLRGSATPQGPQVLPEGRSLRYAAIVALGLAGCAEDSQRAALGGQSAAELAVAALELAQTSDDPGAVALAVWAAAEVAGQESSDALDRLSRLADRPGIPTVDTSWTVVAGLALSNGRGEQLWRTAAGRLLANEGGRGIYPHNLPMAGGIRGHVGCFADQIYPVQAHARAFRATGDPAFLEAANRTARRIVELQGPQGQWWWHYDARTGDVVEGFPVYSVHQHGMAPMALFELLEAGGDDHRAAVASGLDWLTAHPECVEPLIAPELGVIWRKVGRREPRKAARLLSALGTKVRPGFVVPGLDRAFPPGGVDYECRPYELGWLLYAWPDVCKGGLH